MRATIRYIIKNIVSTPVISIIILIILSLSSGLFCVAFDFRRQIVEDTLQKSLTELGDSTFYMTFDESSNVRFFTLNSMRYDADFDKNDFEYIIGGYTFTSVLKTGTIDLPTKVFSYRDTSDVMLGGDSVVKKFSDIAFVKKSRQEAVWFDTDVVIPQKMAQRLGVDLGDKVVLLLGGISKEMTVTGIAENKGLFAGDNILVDYDGLLSTISSQTPISLPLNVFNIALFRLYQQDKAAVYKNMLVGIQDYGDKVVELSPDYQTTYKKNRVNMAINEAVIFLLILLLLFVVFFLASGRLRAHRPTIRLMLEQGAGMLSLGTLFLSEICLFGLAAAVIGSGVVALFGFAASILPSFLCLPLCALAYSSRCISPLLKRRHMRFVLSGCVLLALTLMFIFAKNLFFFAMLLLFVVAAICAADFLTRSSYRLYCRKRVYAAKDTGALRNGFAENEFDLTGRTAENKPIKDLTKRIVKTDALPEEQTAETKSKTVSTASNKSTPVKNTNKGMYWAFAANNSDKTGSVFLVVNSILIVLLIFLFSYIPIMSRLFDTNDAGYVVTNIASAGSDIVTEIESIEGVERAMPVFWEDSKTLLCKQNGEEIYSHVITSRQSDYVYAKSMLSISGGADALMSGKAVVSDRLSKRLGWKQGQLIDVPISGQSIRVEIGAVVSSSLLDSFIIIESTGPGTSDLPYNNIFLKLSDDNENETLTTIRAKYGLQNILIIQRSDLVGKVSKYAADFLDLIRIILIIVALSSVVVLLALFLIKKNRETATEKILKECGASALQIYKMSALCQLIVSLTAIVFGFLLSFVIGFAMGQYFAYLNFAIAFDAIKLLPVALLSEAIIIAAYMLIHALSHLLPNRKK